MAKGFYVDGMTVEQILNLSDDVLSKLNQRDMSRAVRTVALTANKRVNRLLNQAKVGNVITDDGGALHKSRKYINRASSDIALDSLNYISKDATKDPHFSAKGKSRNELYHELKEMQAFMNMKTSTIQGARRVRQMREERLYGKSSEDLINEQIRAINSERRSKGESPLNKKSKKLIEKAVKTNIQNRSVTAWSAYRKYLESLGLNPHSRIPDALGYDSSGMIETAGISSLNGDDEEDIITKIRDYEEERYIQEQEEFLDEFDYDFDDEFYDDEYDF